MLNSFTQPRGEKKSLAAPLVNEKRIDHDLTIRFLCELWECRRDQMFCCRRGNWKKGGRVNRVNSPTNMTGCSLGDEMNALVFGKSARIIYENLEVSLPNNYVHLFYIWPIVNMWSFVFYQSTFYFSLSHSLYLSQLIISFILMLSSFFSPSPSSTMKQTR